MEFLIVTALLYVLGLLLYRPEPLSLKSPLLSFNKNLQQVKGTLFLSCFLIGVFLITANLESLDIQERFLTLFGLHTTLEPSAKGFGQLLTHNFIHLNAIHLLLNVVALVILSSYERRVGTVRFFVVFAMASLGSSISLIFNGNDLYIAGASGGIYGLGAAFFTDHKNTSLSDWFKLIGLFVFVVFILSLEDMVKGHSQALPFAVDTWGHALGALTAILFCKLVPLKDPGVAFVNNNRLRIALSTLVLLVLVFGVSAVKTKNFEAVLENFYAAWTLNEIEFHTPESAMVNINSETSGLSLAVDPKIWVNTTDGTSAAEYTFQMYEAEVYVNFITEKTPISPIGLVNFVHSNVKSLGGVPSLIEQERRIVNDIELFFINYLIEDDVEGNFVFSGYYHTGKEGTTQLQVITSQDVYETHSDEVFKFMNGIHKQES